MKKILLVILVIGILGGAGAYVYFNRPIDDSGIEKILPANPVGYMRVSHFAKNIENIAASTMWKSIQSLDYDLLVKADEMSEKERVSYESFKKGISNQKAIQWLKKFFGKDFAIAYYPSEVSFDLMTTKVFTLDMGKEILTNFFIVTRIPKEIQFIEFLTLFFDVDNDQISTSTIDYKENTIRVATINDKGIDIGFVRINDYLIAGLGTKAAEAAIDVALQEQPAMNMDEKFNKVKKTYISSADIQGYVDMQSIFIFLKERFKEAVAISDAEEFENNENIDKLYSMMNGFQEAGFSGRLTDPSKFQFKIFINKDELDRQMAMFYTCPPTDNHSIKFVPKEVMGYYWNGCFYLGDYWTMINDEFNSFDSEDERLKTKARIEGFQNSVGLNIEKDIIPAFGKEFGWYFTDIKLEGLFPIPEFLIFIKVGQQAKMDAILNKLTQQPMMIQQKENYGKTQIQYFVSPLGESLQPSYCYLNDYLLIAINRKVLKNAIDSLADKNLSLLTSESFNHVDFGLTEKNTSVQYFRIDKIVAKLEGIIKFSNQWVDSQVEKQRAFKTGSTQRLNDVRQNMKSLEEKVAMIKERIPKLGDELWNLESKGEDVTLKNQEIQQLRNQIQEFENELQAVVEQEKELAVLIDNYGGQVSNIESQRLYLEEAIYPLLRSLDAMEALGARTTFDGMSLDTSMSLKFKN